MSYGSYSELREAIELSSDILACTMEDLRVLQKAGRLGTHVVKGIHDKLRQHGIGHVPLDLPTYQHKRVLLFKLGTPTAEVIEATHNPSEASADRIREAISSDHAETIQRIKELVC